MNFKKHISIFLALFILFVNSSASFVLHYCQNQIAYVSFGYHESKIVNYANNDTCCIEDDKSDDKSCCSDQEIKSDKNIDYSILKGFQFNVLAVNFTNELFTFKKVDVLLHLNKKILDYYCDSNPPPFYKLYSQLIFYA